MKAKEFLDANYSVVTYEGCYTLKDGHDIINTEDIMEAYAKHQRQELIKELHEIINEDIEEVNLITNDLTIDNDIFRYFSGISNGLYRARHKVINYLMRK